MNDISQQGTGVLLLAPVSAGELLDKITILEIKSQRMHAPEKLKNVARERAVLEKVAADELTLNAEGHRLVDALRVVNTTLWEVEDAIREHEVRKDFGSTFIDLARAVYTNNDHRAALKRAINTLVGSDLTEEKSYTGMPAPDSTNAPG